MTHRFDGYAGNVSEVPFVEVASVLGHALKAQVVRGRPIKRYGEVLRIEHGGRALAWVGRDQGNDLSYFEGKGESSPDLVAAVREYFPRHSVSRADVCEDYDEEGAFETLQGLIREVKGPRVKGGYVALSDDPEDGRTWQAGVRGGVNMIRVYEAGKMKERLKYGRPHWVRVENEARPHYALDKLAAATMQPLEFWGLSGWTQRVGEALLKVEVPRYEVERDRPTHDKTKVYIATAFRRFFEECFNDGQDWTCIGRDFEEVWRENDAIAARLKA